LVNGGTTTISVPHATDPATANGSVFYFGVINTDTPFNRIIFNNSVTTGADSFVFDDFTASLTQGPDDPIAPTPEPASLLLLGSSLAAAAAAWKRRKKGNESA